MSLPGGRSIHICCTVLHTQPGVAAQFISDVTEQVAIIMKNPNEKTTGMVSYAVPHTLSQTMFLNCLLGPGARLDFSFHDIVIIFPVYKVILHNNVAHVS